MYTSEALFIARKWTGKQNSRNKKQQRELKKEIADANCRREASKQQQTKGMEVGRKTKNTKNQKRKNTHKTN